VIVETGEETFDTPALIDDALMAGRSRRGNGNDGYYDAGPQAMLELR